MANCRSITLPIGHTGIQGPPGADVDAPLAEILAIGNLTGELNISSNNGFSLLKVLNAGITGVHTDGSDVAQIVIGPGYTSLSATDGLNTITHTINAISDAISISTSGGETSLYSLIGGVSALTLTDGGPNISIFQHTFGGVDYNTSDSNDVNMFILAPGILNSTVIDNSISAGIIKNEGNLITHSVTAGPNSAIATVSPSGFAANATNGTDITTINQISTNYNILVDSGLGPNTYIDIINNLLDLKSTSGLNISRLQMTGGAGAIIMSTTDGANSSGITLTPTLLNILVDTRMTILSPGISMPTLQVGDAGLVAGDCYFDTNINAIANGDLVLIRKV